MKKYLISGAVVKAIAGRESVTKFINSSCSVVNGLAQSANTANSIASIPAKFPAKR